MKTFLTPNLAKTAFILLLLLAACTPKQTEESSKNSEVNNTDTLITDAATTATSHTSDLQFNGTLMAHPQQYASITLPIDGTIRSIATLPGKAVKKGDLIATVINPEFIRLQQEYLEASSQVEYLKAEYDRQQVLNQGEAASLKTLQQSRSEYLTMQTRMQAAAAMLDQLGVTANDLHTSGIQSVLSVKSTIGGFVSNMGMNIGKNIPAGTPLCEVVDKQNMLIRLTVYERDIVNFQTNTSIEFRVNGLDDQAFQAKVISIGQEVNDISRSLEIYARIEKSDARFRPGMYVLGRIVKAK